MIQLFIDWFERLRDFRIIHDLAGVFMDFSGYVDSPLE